ncbi:MAG: hypothetical protein IVW36_01870 [Dehalococcoidia bacterium]|nr:hypothetical protein [Dehalococcoidia bacterium]
MRWIAGFGQFWYDFIVGDSIVLAIGGVAVLVVGYALARADYARLAEVVLPALVIATLAFSLRRK